MVEDGRHTSMTKAGDLCNFLNGLKPAMAMVLTQLIFAGVNVFYKLATIDGMDLRILIAYRYIFATIFFAPLAFFVERNSRPKLTWMVTFQAFLCGLFGGTLAQNLYLSSLTLTSVTFAAAMTNLIPAVTYILAGILGETRDSDIRGESEDGRHSHRHRRGNGTDLLQRTEINIWLTGVDLTRGFGMPAASHRELGSRILGSLLALGCCFSYAIWLIVQAKMIKSYPCYLSCSALMCMMGSITGVIYALCMERKWEEWKLGWNIRLWTVAYAGIMASGLMFTLTTWGSRARGPLFVSIFNPLGVVLVAIVDSLLLNEKLHVGSIVGAALIVVGLYVVFWGKGKEVKKASQLMLLSKRSKEAKEIEVGANSSTLSSSSPTTIDTPINNVQP